jgi:hypothetical protein
MSTRTVLAEQKIDYLFPRVLTVCNINTLNSEPFSPVVRIGTSPLPSPADECVPPPFGSGGVTDLLAGEGVGGSQFGRGDIHCGTLVTYVLSAYEYLLGLSLLSEQSALAVGH